MIGGTARRLLLVGGKQGLIYLLDRDDLGGYHPDGDRILEKLSISSYFIFGGATYFDDGMAVGLNVWAANANLDQFILTDSANGDYLALVAQSTVPTTKGIPGGFLSLSANGIDGGLLWANHPWSPVDGADASAFAHPVPGVLRAFDVRDVSVELWNNRADPNAPAESVGYFAKFCAPTIANGKVYYPVWHPDDDTAPAAVVGYGKLP
jgi:hypothetical protein